LAFLHSRKTKSCAEHSGRYKHIIEALVKANYAVYINDHRGHGKSEGKRNHINSFNEYVDDSYKLTKVIKEKLPNLPLFLIGHSMGSLVSQRFAIQHQEELQGMVLSGSGTRPMDTPQLLVLTAKVLVKIFPTLKLPSGIVPDELSTDPNSVKDYITDPLIHYKKVTVATGVAFMNHYSEIGEKIKTIQIPVLLQKGKKDVLMLGFDELVNDFKTEDLTVKIYDEAKHEVFTERKEIRELVFKDLINWLDSHIE